MYQNPPLKLAGLVIILVTSFAFVIPVKAFYLEIPKFFKDTVKLIQSVNAEETTEIISPAEPQQTTKTPYVQTQPMMNQEQNQQIQPWAGLCNPDGNGNPTSLACVDVAERFVTSPKVGPDGKPVCPEGSLAKCGDYPQNNQQQNNFNMQNGQLDGQMEQGPNEEQQQKMQKQQLKDMQRGARDIERQLKQFELMIAKFTKKKVVISEEIKTKIADLKILVEKYKAVATVEEAALIDPQEMWDKMRELEEERQNLERTENVMREMRRIETGVKMFEKQVQRLVKQKLAINKEITDNLERVKALINNIKNGKMENAEEIFELMQGLDEHRGELEMLSRWPQTVRQMNMELKNLTRELKRVKPIVNRLVKKGIDLTSVYNNFESSINNLTEVKKSAVAKISEDAEGVFESVQNDFFSQLEDTWESHKIIMTMNNLGRFNSDFKRGIANDSWQIKLLKKKKINTSELEDMLEQAKTKGAEVLQLFKEKPLDPDAVIAILEDLQNLSQDFDQKIAELTGEEKDMPWEKGQQQFKKIDISPNLDNWIPKKAPQPQEPPMQQEQPTQQLQQTCNINGVEMPGNCDQYQQQTQEQQTQ